jgi:hypothetical protein
MRVNSKLFLNEVNESELQNEKQDEQRIWTWGRMVIDLREEQW